MAKSDETSQVKINLSLTESLCGFTRIIESIDGKKLNVCMDEVVNKNNVHMVSGVGMPNKYGGRGNMIITYSINYPAMLTESQKILIRQADI